MKVHRVFGTAGVTHQHTACGVKCWPSTLGQNEAETATGFRIETTETWLKVTCRGCLKLQGALV